MSHSTALMIRYLRRAFDAARHDHGQKVAYAYIGEIILANLLDGLEQELFDKTFANGLIQCWMRNYDRQRQAIGKADVPSGTQSLFKDPTPSEMLADSFDLVCGMPSPDCPEAPHRQRGFRIRCTRPLDNATVKGDYVSITGAKDFVDEIMDPEEKRKKIGENWIPTILSSGNIDWAGWRPPKKIPVKLKNAPTGNPTSTIGNPARVLWITPEAGLTLMDGGGLPPPSTDGSRGATSTPAHLLRDRLGLVHHFEKPLLAMTLPAATVHAMTHGRPTCADAGSQRRHMARGAGKSAPTDPWGRTADLSRITPTAVDFDGLPERIVEPIPVGELPEIEVQPLGFCGPERGNSPQDDNRVFADHLCRRHGGVDGVVDTLERVLA
ncbi:MAG: hypothetical protein HQL82_01890 [Magnetococcales bacterium]|nr:hypothetical protein [Magnetococcales bacterium]